MGFFKNRTFNVMYVHTALQSFAMNGGEAFAFIYLLKAGIAVPIVLLSIGGMFGCRIILRRTVLPLVKAVGLRTALIIGILLEALAYPLLSQVSSVGPLLIAYLLLWAFSSSIYWTTHHAYITLLGDNENRGKQVGLMEFIYALMGIGAPIATGTLLTFFDPLVAFGVVGIAMAAAAIPVWLSPERAIADDAVVAAETKRQAFNLMLADGLRAGAFHFTWLVALFITLGSSYVAYGGTMSLASIAGAVMGLFVGRSIDLGNGLRAAKIGFAAIGVAAAARAFGYSIPFTAVLANAAAAVAWPLYGTTFNTRMYVLARQSPCPLRYHITAEGGWDLGVALSCSFSAAMIAMGFSFFFPLAFALLAFGFGYLMMVKTFEPETV